MSLALATKGMIGEGAAVTWAPKEYILSDFFLELELDEPSLEVESGDIVYVEAETDSEPELRIDVDELMALEVDVSDLALELVVEVE